MTISDTLPALLDTTNEIADIRRQQGRWALADGPAQEFLVSAGAQMRHNAVIGAVESQIANLRDPSQDAVALRHNSTIADLLEQEAEAILHFHRAVLDANPARAARANGEDQPPRPLKRAIKMMDTFMGSLLDLFGELMPTWAKASIIVYREAAALVID